MTDMPLSESDFPAHYAEWVQGDHMLIGWALIHGGMIIDPRHNELSFSYESPAFIAFDADLFGLPILTPELRKRLGDEWRKWKDAE